MAVAGAGKFNLRQSALTAVLTGAVMLVVTVVAGMILFALQAREPRLVYSARDIIPFRGEDRFLAVYHVWIANQGGSAAEEVVCTVSVPEATIDEWTVSAAPVLSYTDSLVEDTVWLNVPWLNADERLELSLVATAPRTALPREALPGIPKVELRAKGFRGIEQPWEGRSVRDRLRDFGPWILAVIIGAAAGLVTWLLRRWRIVGRIADRVRRAGRRRRAADFEDNFESGLLAWRKRSKVSTSSVGPRGLALGAIPARHDLSTVLTLYREPRFADGTVECEVYLESGALFNLVLRGDIVDDEFYMARLDARPDYWDSILVKPRGRAWRECNKGHLSHHSPYARWLTMRVEADGPEISLYRDDQLVDSVNDAEFLDGTIAVFAEEGTAYVRVLRIWRD